jgi:DNA excision repair protein ERCC-2
MGRGGTLKYTIAVRALCEFTARHGDLDLRFTPSPTALEGMAGHATVAARRAPPYQSEVSLSGEFKHLIVRGRADGYDPARNQLEEIKTYRGSLESIPDNHRTLHWAQLKLYGWLQCQALGLAEVRLALVYFDVVKQTETALAGLYTADSLEQFFKEQCGIFLDWADQELEHRSQRDLALASLAFPHEVFRPGQRELAVAVYKAASQKRCLMVQAPTGIGKTLGTLFPMLKAVPGQKLDKVFFLAAKTPGRKLALHALARLGQPHTGLPLRVIELVARDKACVHPDRNCHGESCPLARGFYDRLPAARSAAVATNAMWDKEWLRATALDHQVCPYYLGHDLVRWSDVAVGDYNYYFDSSAMLYGLTVSHQWRVGVLVDEAHNMIDRARQMYTAELEQTGFRQARQSAPASLAKAMDSLNRRWNETCRDQTEPYRACGGLPDKFMAALQQAMGAIAGYLSENPTYTNPPVQRFYLEALHFSRMAEQFDSHSLFDISMAARGPSTDKKPTGSLLCIRNIIPAPFLEQRFAAAQSAVLFSATLNPWPFYSNTLGLPKDTATLDVPSPFAPEQLAIHQIGTISTRYQDRQHSLAPMIELIAGQYRRQNGNYLCFFSSFDYLEKAAGLFKLRYPGIPIRLQSRRMLEADKEQFLALFTPSSQEIGFAVLGGAFAEGVDLPGRRLIGAFIATLGLPQVNPVNEQIKQRMNTAFGSGYRYTYLYPGLQKVVQAAGRVIRSPDDRGVIYLMDDRYARAEVRSLLPKWWRIESSDGAPALSPH